MKLISENSNPSARKRIKKVKRRMMKRVRNRNKMNVRPLHGKFSFRKKDSGNLILHQIKDLVENDFK